MADNNADKALLARLDIAIDKLTDVSADIKAVLAVHEAKFDNQEQLNQTFYDQIEKLHLRIGDLRDENTKQHDAITIWDACKNDEGYVKLKHFAEELQKAGMEEEETKRLIDRWEKNNVIKLNKDGSYERI